MITKKTKIKHSRNKQSRSGNKKTIKHTIKKAKYVLDLSLASPLKTSSTEYPLYKHSYNFNLSRIHNLVNNLISKKTSQLLITPNIPNQYIPNQHKQHKPNKPYQKIHTFNNTNKYYIIKSSWNDNLELNSLTDYFTEPCRIQCTFKNNLSPLEYWNKNQQTILANLKKKQLPPNNYNIREEMYIHNKPCNNFRISVCLEVLKLFKPKKWLDISAGWGDRLMSALLYQPLEVYCGVDPNPCLHPYYQEMIKTLDPNGKKECILIKDGFETAVLPNIKFDLVFSSPPFFDLEIYSTASANSLVKYKGEDGWFNGFLMPSIYKAIEYLTEGGYLVLYMGESQGTKYIPKMIELVNARMKNAGMFYYTDGAKLREFFCWKKNI
jgi:hypothetical protein